MVGVNPVRDEEHARLSGARADFIANLARRLEALRASLRALEQAPGDNARRNGLLRRLHALGSAAKVLGFASVAEALGEAEKRLRRSSSVATELIEVARALDLLPSLVLGAPAATKSREPAEASQTWPLSVLIFGTAALSDALASDADLRVEVERTEDPVRARELARVLGPDIAVVDADRKGARELVDLLANDPLIEPVPVIVVGELATHEAAGAFIGLGAARVLPKPVSPDTLRRTIAELYGKPAEPRSVREPLGDQSIETLATRVAEELRRGLIDAVDPSSTKTHINFGEGTDVMAAVWGAVARVRELVTVRSHGAVRFYGGGPEGAIPLAPFRDDRRPGERGVRTARDADNVALQGRRVLIADDDPAVVWFMSGLAKAFGAEVVEAHDGARALDLAFETWPDIVVSDVLMPELDGFSLCHELKRDVAIRDVPVILLSWKEDLLQRVRELGADADGYLRKEAAASTVAERLREVLRPRARVEERLASGGEVRGRLDGLTPRLILELLCAGQRDARVSFRDAVYLYEVQVRAGRVRSASRSASDGSFERGESVLAGLLGVSAGRFVVQPDSAPCRSDFDASLPEILREPIMRARMALRAIAAHELFQVTSVQIDDAAIRGYLGCTPEPARSLTERLMSGTSPRELIATGGASPRLLEAVLSDLARRGAIVSVQRADGRAYASTFELPLRRLSPARGLSAVTAPLSLPPSIPPNANPSEKARIAVEQLKIADTDEESGWFTFDIETSSKPPSVAPPPVVVTKAVAPDPKPPAVIPQPSKPEVVPQPSKPEVVPQPSKPEVTPEPQKPETPPQEPPKPEIPEPTEPPDVPVRVSEKTSKNTALGGTTLVSAAPAYPTNPPPSAGIKFVHKAPRPATPDPAPVIEMGESVDADIWASALADSDPELPKVASTEVLRLPAIDASLMPGLTEDEARSRRDGERVADEASSLFSDPLATDMSHAAEFDLAERMRQMPETQRLVAPDVETLSKSDLRSRPVESDPNESTDVKIGRPSRREVVQISGKATALGGAARSVPNVPSESGGVLRTVAIAALAAGIAFAVVRWGVAAWLGSAASSVASTQAPEASVTPPPVVAAKVQPTATGKFALNVSALDAASGIAADRGLLQIETEGAELLYVDGEFVGRGPSRSVPLAAGRHELRVLRDTEEFSQSVEIEQGKRVLARLTVTPALAPSSSAR